MYLIWAPPLDKYSLFHWHPFFSGTKSVAEQTHIYYRLLLNSLPVGRKLNQTSRPHLSLRYFFIKYSMYLAFRIQHPKGFPHCGNSGPFQILYTCKQYINGDTSSVPSPPRSLFMQLWFRFYSQTSNPKHKVPNHNLNISLIVTLIPQAGIHRFTLQQKSPHMAFS